MTAKIGRPSVKNPNNLTLSVRIDRETMKVLDDYCERKEKSRGQAVRTGILLLAEQK